jgi:hypothetical protein
MNTPDFKHTDAATYLSTNYSAHTMCETAVRAFRSLDDACDAVLPFLSGELERQGLEIDLPWHVVRRALTVYAQVPRITGAAPTFDVVA